MTRPTPGHEERCAPTWRRCASTAAPRTRGEAAGRGDAGCRSSSCCRRWCSSASRSGRCAGRALPVTVAVRDAVDARRKPARRRCSPARATSSPATATSRSACASPAASTATSSRRDRASTRATRWCSSTTATTAPRVARTEAGLAVARANLDARRVRAGTRRRRCAQQGVISQQELDVLHNKAAGHARHGRAARRGAGAGARQPRVHRCCARRPTASCSPS